METTHKAPNVPVAKFKRTKIIATIGPSTDSYEAILNLIKAGANGIRLNFSHGTQEERIKQIRWIRKAAKEYGKPVAIIQDLQGPKIRLGDFEGIVPVQAGQSLSFAYKADYQNSGHLPTQYDLSKKVRRGERLFLYDGKVKTVVSSVKDGVVHVRAENDGILIKRKGINLPDTDFGGDIITKKDKADLAFGSEHDIDYVAQSFVQSGQDIRTMRRLIKNLGMNAKIIVKFETKAAVANMQEIVREADVIMVARGDLAVEALPESVPIVQRQLVGLGMQYAKPTIIATQMLFSMTESSEPTRAEVSDIATAVIIGADCVMLSDETANGRYPIESVEMMKRVILYTQENSPIKAVYTNTDGIKPTKQAAICNAVISLADEVNAKAIVAETKSGATALQLVSRRPRQPLVAVTSDPRVAQQLAIAYGTKSYVRPDDKLAATKLTNWLRQKKVLAKGDMIVTASGQYPGVVGTTDTIKVRVLE
ncbi:MAG TPA: pyruvate kinase [Candidatus Saccharimonadales bacterium]|nr:pyruvate kinase [Candidatus Saccharimonadales bacterium]